MAQDAAREFLDGKVFADVDDAQSAIDAWIWTYNHDRPAQGIGVVVPWERFRLADPDAFDQPDIEPAKPLTTRTVGRNGKVSFAGYLYPIRVWLAGETVDVTVDAGVVSVSHRGVLVASDALRHRPGSASGDACIHKDRRQLGECAGVERRRRGTVRRGAPPSVRSQC